MTEAEAKTKWCPVSGFEGRFEVSNTGSIRSLPRRVRRRDGTVFVHGCELLGRLAQGYRRVCLSGDDEQIQKFVHVLVAEAFLPPRPSPAHMVNHKDGRRDNNHWLNLEWVTASENQIHSWRVLGRRVTATMRASAPKGEKNGRAKLSDDEVRVIKERHSGWEGATCTTLAKVFGVHPATISRIVRDKSRGLAGKP